MAVNYMEDGTRKEPAEINAFQKTAYSIIGPGDTMVLPDAPATVFEGEAELALVIGKTRPTYPRQMPSTTYSDIPTLLMARPADCREPAYFMQ